MKDRDFLHWIHARLAFVHGENSNSDYMRKLLGIVAATPADQETPNSNLVDPSRGGFIDLARLAAQCTGKRDRECLYRLAKEVAIIDQDFELAMRLRALQTANRPRLRKGAKHAPGR